MAEVKHKEGRHVGLDFYDLLIEEMLRQLTAYHTESKLGSQGTGNQTDCYPCTRY